MDAQDPNTCRSASMFVQSRWRSPPVTSGIEEWFCSTYEISLHNIGIYASSIIGHHVGTNTLSTDYTDFIYNRRNLWIKNGIHEQDRHFTLERVHRFRSVFLDRAAPATL